jgi:hypothetical protein
MIRAFLLSCILVLLLTSSAAWAAQGGALRYGVNPEVRSIRAEKPVKIKLKRSKEGKYTWEITGDNSTKVIEADRELREEYKK